jgi:prophage regulatory protein
MPRVSGINPNISAELPKQGFVRLPTVLSVFPVSPASWWNGIKAGKYPKGVKLGERTTAWRVEDIRNLIERMQ